MNTVEKETVEGAVRPHRQNRNTLAALKNRLTKMFWPSNKGTYNVGKNAAKREKKATNA